MYIVSCEEGEELFFFLLYNQVRGNESSERNKIPCINK